MSKYKEYQQTLLKLQAELYQLSIATRQKEQQAIQVVAIIKAMEEEQQPDKMAVLKSNAVQNFDEGLLGQKIVREEKKSED